MNEIYDGTSIKVLKGLAAVRARPAMYISNTGKTGLHHLFIEILDNSIDENMVGYGDTINIVLHKDGETLSIEDFGRGIPIDAHLTEKISTLEVVLTQLHAGGKFDDKAYATGAGGLHGVGASCVNALSDKMKAEVWRDGYYYVQEYSQGKPLYSVKKVREIGRGEKKNGTKITFHPDILIFKEGIKFDQEIIKRNLREEAFLNKALKLNFTNEVDNTKEEFYYEGGISDYVKWITSVKTNHYPIEPIYESKKSSLISREGDVSIEISLQWNNEDDETILSFANNINTHDGGTHLSGFKVALTRTINAFARKLDLIKEKDNNLTGDDIREGLTAIISVRFSQPEFVGQTKDKLGTVEIEGIVTTAVTEMLTSYFDKNTAVVKKIVERAKIAQEARDAAKKQSALIKRKSFLGNNRLPGKLADCNSNKAELSELFVVEGQSAGGGMKLGRDPEFQAILPVKGKILNAEKSDLTTLLKNAEIQSLILSIGAGFKEDFDVSKIRYGKVLIAVDPDVDGNHICSLMITFFYKYMRELIQKGHLFMPKCPLFKVAKSNKIHYCFTKEEMQNKVKELGDGAKVTRFKGLGEMNPDEIAHTLMKKESRKLIKITLEDAAEAERMISVLMGDNAQLRKDHISKFVRTE